MKRHLVLLTSLAASAAYTYDHVQSFANALANWQSNGSGNVVSSLWTATTATGGSLISQHPNLAGVNTYEIKANITLTASGGNYVFCLAAPSNALMGQTSANGILAARRGGLTPPIAESKVPFSLRQRPI